MDSIWTKILADTSHEEIDLQASPLAAVYLTVDFSETFALEDSSVIAGIQGELGEKYPRSHDRRNQDTKERRNSEVLELHNLSYEWVVELSTNSVRIRTRNYDTRADLIDRAVAVVDAIRQQAQPSLVDRIELRYVNQVPLVDMRPKLLRYPDSMIPIPNTIEGWSTCHTQATRHFTSGTDELTVSYGQGSAIPGTLDVDEVWFLDLSCERDLQAAPMTTFDVAAEVEELGSLAYQTFRSIVSDKFIQFHLDGTQAE